jgi:hypothetical protein
MLVILNDGDEKFAQTVRLQGGVVLCLLVVKELASCPLRSGLLLFPFPFSQILESPLTHINM